MALTTYTLTDTIYRAGELYANAPVDIYLCNLDGELVDGHVTGMVGQVVAPFSTTTSDVGVLAVTLIANSTITPANTYYQPVVAGRKLPIIAATANGSLSTLAVVSPSALGPSAGLDNLSDVTITSPTNGQVLTYDSGTGQWVNAASGAGAAIADQRLMGNVSGVSAAPIALTQAQVRTFLAYATVAVSGSASDLSTGTLLAARLPALTGDVTSSAGSAATTIAAGVVGTSKLAAIAANSLWVNATGSSAAPTELAMGASTMLARLAAGNIVAATPAQIKTLLAIALGDVSGVSGQALTGDVGGTIGANTITGLALTKLASIADQRILGNVSGGSAAAIALTQAQIKTFLGLTVFATATAGTSGQLLKGDGSLGTLGTLAALSTITSTEITDGTIANADLANMANKTFKGRHTAGAGVPEDVSAANVLADLSGAAGASFDWNTQKTINQARGTANADGAVVGQVGTNIFSDPLKTLSSFTSMASILSVSAPNLPASAVGDMFHIWAAGTVLNTAGAGSTTFAVRPEFGGDTSLILTFPAFGGAVNSRMWTIDMYCRVVSSSTLMFSGNLFCGGTSTTVWSPITAANSNNAGGWLVTVTTNAPFSFDLKWSSTVNHANAQVFGNLLFIERLPV